MDLSRLRRKQFSITQYGALGFLRVGKFRLRPPASRHSMISAGGLGTSASDLGRVRGVFKAMIEMVESVRSLICNRWRYCNKSNNNNNNSNNNNDKDKDKKNR